MPDDTKPPGDQDTGPEDGRPGVGAENQHSAESAGPPGHPEPPQQAGPSEQPVPPGEPVPPEEAVPGEAVPGEAVQSGPAVRPGQPEQPEPMERPMPAGQGKPLGEAVHPGQAVPPGQTGQPEPLPGLGDLPEALPGLRASLEAILLVMDEPAEEVVLAQVLERPRGEVSAALRELSDEYTADGRGFDLREVAGGWRFYTRADCAPVVERFVRDGQEARLTQAALETLAVVAYRQPVSRSRVSAVRGVNCDGVMRTLVLRGLVEEAGTDHETSAILYRTTSYFLERLGLRTLEELPELAPFLPVEVPEDTPEGQRDRR